MHLKTFSELVNELRLDSFCPKRAYEAMARLSLTPQEIARFSLFSSTGYTRNLIFRSEEFELLTLCWEHGQQTPLHDHNSSRGWMRTLVGAIEEDRFQITGHPQPYLEPLVPESDHVAYIDDDIGVHILRNNSRARAVSLHLYAPPIVSCSYYDPKTLAKRTASMRYHSVDGVMTTSQDFEKHSQSLASSL